MKQITIYTDGACSGNPGPGGWSAIIICDNKEEEISGFEKFTTNNKMELLAPIRAIQTLKDKAELDIFTDSTYVKNGITKWILSWMQNNWQTSRKEDVKNKELWQELWEATHKHVVKWHWVRGHGNNRYNNRVDQSARDVIVQNMAAVREAELVG